MQTSDFHFDLPEHLIAQVPAASRGEDRLLVLNRTTGAIEDHDFSEFPYLVEPDTLLVFNDSRVRRARIYAEVLATGSRVEFLLINPVIRTGLQAGTLWKVMAKNAKRQKPGREYRFPDGLSAIILDDTEGLAGGEFRLLSFSSPVDDTWLDRFGHIPLPPYIHRDDEALDADRYQTVYARTTGSVAAPTAGLHFTPAILDELDTRGIERTSITLHVGLGTFLPVRTDNIEEHTMHEERFIISEETAYAVEKAKKDGRPIMAVGTTSVRTLESAWDRTNQQLRTGEQATTIFIYPGYEFSVVNRLFTNFHTPESTLVMLVSAFAGKKEIFNAYRHAVEKEYRFFSYGDSMLIR